MPFIHKLCERLGENNKPIYTVLAIACGKGTVRPILSITDKKEAPDARKYAALRELMTEFIGVPTTMALGMMGEGAAKLLTKKDSIKRKNASSVLSFLGICLAAGYFVPKFCNLGMPPVMKKLMPDYGPDAIHTPKTVTPAQKNPIGFKQSLPVNYNIYKVNQNSPFYRTGMRV